MSAFTGHTVLGPDTWGMVYSIYKMWQGFSTTVKVHALSRGGWIDMAFITIFLASCLSLCVVELFWENFTINISTLLQFPTKVFLWDFNY